MALRKMVMGLVLVLVVASWAVASAQMSCMSVIISLSPCLNFVTGNASTPSSSCCTQLASVVRTQVQCLCTVLNGGSSSLGITINQTQALALPAACNVKTPPASQCNGASGSPPVESPADAPDSTPSTPINPSANSMLGPSETQTKTVPSAGNHPSDASSLALPLYLIFFLSFVGSYAAGTLTVD